MDSGLLNAFHDDPFDGNYRKYNTATDFWSSEGETMGLAETLHGILPISATDDDAQLYTSALLKDDLHADNTIVSTHATKPNRNVFGNDNYLEQEPLNKQKFLVQSAYSSDSDSDEDDDDVNARSKSGLEMHASSELAFERHSECSQQTFRTRTDSSSIGDYESHSSDYEDETETPFPPTDVNDILNDLPNDLLAPDDFMLLDDNFKFPLSKKRTFSTNTIASDVDALGIDANNFDLAEFITKDDFVTNTPKSTPNSKRTAETSHSSAKTSRQSTCIDSDAESDIIVDVETVELEDEMNVKQKLIAAATQNEPTVEEDALSYVDNVKRDPSWCPTATKKTEQCSKVSSGHSVPAAIGAINAAATVGHANVTRKYPLMPNKKQCDILKRKFGTGRGGKNLMAQRNAKLAAKKAQEQQKTNKDANVKATGKGLGGKNLSLLKQARCSISEQSSEENSSPIKPVIQLPEIKVETNVASPKVAVKRKLNLEEYKQRRYDKQETILGNTDATLKCKQIKLPNSSTAYTTQPRVNSTPQLAKQIPIMNNHQASEAVKTIVQNLKAQNTETNNKTKPATDPITEAKNKVLRMQELKKAQQIKILDSTVSAKVPRVTKLLPLKEIVKDTYPVGDDEPNETFKVHPDYEEIIIVSVSCNTDITLPPIQKVTSMSPRSLLKPSVKLNITTSSLIASIQNEVVKKTQENNNNVHNALLQTGKTILQQQQGERNADHQHGEDKIIMHLRKDRIRQRTMSVGTQTDLLPEFPVLPFPKAVITHKSRERTREEQHRRQIRHYRKQNANNVIQNLTNTSYSSSDSDSSRSRTCSRSPSYTSSLERQRCTDSHLANGGYSSRSSRRHRSSVSSSYSETEHVSKKQGHLPRQRQRQRRYSYKKSKRIHASRSSSTSSLSDYTSRSRSRTRSRSPLQRRSRSRSPTHSKRANYNNNNRNNYVDRNVSQPAVEERRIVYVGRIEQETTKEMLRRKFLAYGNIKQVTIHFKDTGMKYGFVTFERSQDAFAAIDNSARDPQISMYDVSFGGRRAFCRATYADLDNAGINTYQSFVFPQAQAAPKEDDSFEALLLKVKAKLNANKTKSITTTNTNGSNSISEGTAKI